MSKNTVARSLGFFLLFLLDSTVSADELILQNGDRLTGAIVKKTENILIFETAYAGELSIPWNHVRELRAEEPLTIWLASGETITTKVIENQPDAILLEAEPGASPRTVNPAAVTAINPEPWQLGDGFKLSGRVNLALQSERGNTDTDELDIDGKIEFRRQQQRVVLDGQLENDRASGEKTTDKWLVTGKYDYSVTPKRYYGAVLYLESDQFADVNLRSGIGPLVGYRFIESDATNLVAEAGIIRIREDFIDQADNNFWSAYWQIDFDRFLFGEIMQFYHEQRGAWSFEDSSNVRIRSWTGLRFPLRGGFVASAEAQVDFDNKPATDAIDKTDTTYRLKLGYEW